MKGVETLRNFKKIAKNRRVIKETESELVIILSQIMINRYVVNHRSSIIIIPGMPRQQGQSTSIHQQNLTKVQKKCSLSLQSVSVILYFNFQPYDEFLPKNIHKQFATFSGGLCIWKIVTKKCVVLLHPSPFFVPFWLILASLVFILAKKHENLSFNVIYFKKEIRKVQWNWNLS